MPCSSQAKSVRKHRPHTREVIGEARARKVRLDLRQYRSACQDRIRLLADGAGHRDENAPYLALLFR